MQNYSFQTCRWQDYQTELSHIRREVFIKEQNVPEELEWDEFDKIAQHVIALDSNKHPIGTGRIKEDGHIGRMAVLIEHRKRGVGSAILEVLLEYANKKNLVGVYLHAQVEAIPFYEHHGFTCQGDKFMDAGIPHKTMFKELK